MLYRIISVGYVHRTVFQWVPGHCGLDRNEKADKNAKRHAEILKQTDPLYHKKVPSSYKTITSYYKEKLAHNWRMFRQSLIEVILAQLRTGYCKLLGTGLSYVTAANSYRYNVDGATVETRIMCSTYSTVTT